MVEKEAVICVDLLLFDRLTTRGLFLHVCVHSLVDYLPWNAKLGYLSISQGCGGVGRVFPFLHSFCVKSASVCVCVWGGGGGGCIGGYSIFLHLGFFSEWTLTNVPVADVWKLADAAIMFANASVWLLLACLNVCVWKKRPNLNNRPTLKTKLGPYLYTAPTSTSYQFHWGCLCCWPII